MARAPFQVLVFPYRYNSEGEIEYAVFYRISPRYGSFWQAIAGGGEYEETPLEAAKREAFEEGGIGPESEFMVLDSMATIPAPQVSGFLWGEDVLVVPEYAFGVCVDDHEIVLSKEHKEFRWVDYKTAHEMLTFDSNKSALWELNHRLTRGKKQ
jgi:dATP pyrophosphohydrolase